MTTTKKAFTLIEAMTVAAIIGILSAIFIPILGGIRNKTIATAPRVESRETVANLLPFNMVVNNGKAYYLIPKSYYEEVNIAGSPYYLVPSR